MCKYESSHVAAYVERVQAGDLRLDSVLPYMEESEVVDAAVILMARDGQLRNAMDRLIKHLKKLESTLLGILNSSGEDELPSDAERAIEELLEALQKYTDVGIWLCQGQSKNNQVRMVTSSIRQKGPAKNELLPDEILWLDLIDVVVQITRQVSAGLRDLEEFTNEDIDHEKLVVQLRMLVQRSFTALLTSTSTPTTPIPTDTNLSFLKILRAFLTRASVSSPNLSDLRAVLASIFSAYAYEESILSLANRLLEKDLFVNVESATALRQRGWRPRGSTCEGCGRRVWGPGVSGDIFSRWEEREEQDLKRRRERRAKLAGGQVERGKGRAHVRNISKASIVEVPRSKGDGTAVDTNDVEGNAGIQSDPLAELRAQQDLGPLIVLACRHIYHQSCLEAMQTEDANGTGERDFRCPIDG